MSTMVGARISDEVLEGINFLAKEEKVDKSALIRELLATAVEQKRVELALEKYAARKISLGRAAELSKLPLADFLKRAADRKIPLNYSLESLEKDFRAAR